MLNSLIKLFVKWFLPYPLIQEMVCVVAIRYKHVILSVTACLVLIPVLLFSMLFVSISKVNATNSNMIQKEYFNRKYTVECRDSVYPCEPKPEYLGQGVVCTNEPTKCRKVRKTGECSDQIFKDKYCQESSSTSTITNADGTTSTITTSTLSKKPNADQLYYQDQQSEEELASGYGRYTDGSGFGFGETIDTSGSPGSAQAITTLPTELVGYIEPFINDIGTPNGNPLGGRGYENVVIQCVYHCSNYLVGAGVHQGMDMTPSQKYYNTNRAKNLTGGKIIQFATCSGTAKYEIGYMGSNNVVIDCKDTDYYVTFMHLSTAFVSSSPVPITAGQPIGVMGSTGNSTGPHVHYQINKGCLGYTSSCTRDPALFLTS
jgi:Peptidase family M23